MKRALILGVGGQDGSYLADILLERGYEVAGFHRHSSYDNLARIAHCRHRVKLYRGDVIDRGSVRRALGDFHPDEIYNVADQDNVGWSEYAPVYQNMVTARAVENLLEDVGNGWFNLRACHARVFVPLSVTMFGTAPPPQSEASPIEPRSPYAEEKAVAWVYAKRWRALGVHVSCAVLCNHDSPRRGRDYLLQSICRQAVEVARGLRHKVVVGSISQRVDIGYARDYMEAAVDMLQLPDPDDYMIGTGTAEQIGEMVGRALNEAGVPIDRVLGSVRVDASLAPGLQPTYIADTTKAHTDFGFKPKHSVGDLIKMLVRHHQEQIK